MSTDALIGKLLERRVIRADSPAPPEAGDRPWFLSLLMGIAGWVAGLFVLVFLGIFLDLTGKTPMLTVGLALLGVAWALYLAGRGLVFVDQLALALSIAGQLAITVYFFQTLEAALPVTSAILVMQLVLFIVMPDRTARTLAAFFASIAWVFVLRFVLRPNEGGSDLFLPRGESVALVFGAWTPAVEWLATWVPPIAILTALRRSEPSWMARAAAAFSRPAITGLLLGIALGGIAAEPASLLVFGTDALGQDFNGWGLFPLLSIALAMTAAWNAFLLRSPGLLGLSIVAALAHLARFYYLYGTSLAMKALIMLGAGAVLLGAGRLLGRRAGALP